MMNCKILQHSLAYIYEWSNQSQITVMVDAMRFDDLQSAFVQHRDQEVIGQLVEGIA